MKIEIATSAAASVVVIGVVCFGRLFKVYVMGLSSDWLLAADNTYEMLIISLYRL